jgi:hypothetical protein
MVRVFTTSFIFNHRSYEALVTVALAKDQLRYCVRLLDAELHILIPDGEIRYTGKKGYADLGWIENEHARKLINSLGQAIEEHINNSEQTVQVEFAGDGVMSMPQSKI